MASSISEETAVASTVDDPVECRTRSRCRQSDACGGLLRSQPVGNVDGRADPGHGCLSARRPSCATRIFRSWDAIPSGSSSAPGSVNVVARRRTRRPVIWRIRRPCGVWRMPELRRDVDMILVATVTPDMGCHRQRAWCSGGLGAPRRRWISTPLAPDSCTPWRLACSSSRRAAVAASW